MMIAEENSSFVARDQSLRGFKNSIDPRNLTANGTIVPGFLCRSGPSRSPDQDLRCEKGWCRTALFLVSPSAFNSGPSVGGAEISTAGRVISTAKRCREPRQPGCLSGREMAVCGAHSASPKSETLPLTDAHPCLDGAMASPTPCAPSLPDAHICHRDRMRPPRRV